MESPRRERLEAVDCPGIEQCPLPFDPRFGSILEAMPFGLFILDANGSPIYANEQSTRLLGFGPIKGLTPADLAAAYSAYVAGTDEPYPVERMPVVKALRGERAFENDMEIRRKDGNVFLEVEAAPVLGSDGSIAYAIAIFRDITPTRVMESELRSLVATLESQAIERETRLDHVKDTHVSTGDLIADLVTSLRQAREDAQIARNALALFLANFSHELRTPLNHIIGFSDLIGQNISKGLTDGIDKHAANIRKSGSNLLETLNRIIRFAEIDTGRHAEPELEIFAADDLLEELAEWVTPLAEDRGNTVRLTIDRPIGSMRSDSTFMTTALRQIVENAAKHSADGIVSIVGERLGDDADARIRITVSDEGPGIDPSLVRMLLDGQVSPGDPLVAGGLGVGIPLARRLLEALGGSMSAETGTNGSRFIIELPVFLRATDSQT